MTKKKYIFITFFFVIATIIFTYPLFFKINSGIAGTLTTDEPYAALWNFWWFKYAFTHRIPNTFYSTIAAPFGFDMGNDSLYPVWEFFYRWFAIFTNNIFAFNIQIFLSFVLAGIAMYLLVFYLTRNNTSALFAGLIYAFCPYHFSRAWQHLALAQIQWMPLYILAMIKLKEQLNYRSLFLCISAIFLVISFEFHYAIFVYIITFLFLLYNLVFYKKIDCRQLKLMKMTFLVMSAGLIFVLPTSAIKGIKQLAFEKKSIKPSVWSVVRPFEDLFAQSARPLSYVLPATVHPVFGGFSEQFVGSQLYGTSLTEHTLYLGWVPIILSFLAIRKWRKARNEIKVQSPLGTVPEENFYIAFFVFLAVTAWLFSQPPWWSILGLKLYMPSFFMYKIAPMFRAYCRFGIVVMLAVAVLAGFGLKFILLKCRTRFLKIAITCLLSGLVLFEFWNWPPYKVIDVSVFPAAYTWLKSQPGDFTIAEYPLDTNGANELYKFYQTKHEKKIINGTIPGTYANEIAKAIVKLSGSKTAGILQWIGLRYVLVHRGDYLNSELTEDSQELSKIPANPGLKLIKTFAAEDCPRQDIMCVQKTGPIDVYEVVTQPILPRTEYND